MKSMDRKQLVSFRVKPWLLQSLDAEASARGCSRTDLAVEILERAMLDRHPFTFESAIDQIKASPEGAQMIRDLAAAIRAKGRGGL